MERDRAPCLDCAQPVPTDARVCPDCGYDLAHHDRRRRWLGGLGTALTLSVVLAPVGLLLHRARRHRIAAEGTVTRRGEVRFRDDLRRSLAGFLSLERGGSASPELRRSPGRPARRTPDGRRR